MNRHKETRPTPSQSDMIPWMQNSHWQLTDWITDHFLKFVNFYIFKFRISVRVMSYCWIIASSLSCPKFTVFTFPIKPVTDKIWIHFVYISAFPCWTLRTRLNFPIWLTSPLKDICQPNCQLKNSWPNQTRQ